MDMLEQRYDDTYGKECFRNCDVVDLISCLRGAVDAMHNTLGGIARGGEEQDRIGIVVLLTKYDLGSSGEYTKELEEVQF